VAFQVILGRRRVQFSCLIRPGEIFHDLSDTRTPTVAQSTTPLPSSALMGSSLVKTAHLAVEARARPKSITTFQLFELYVMKGGRHRCRSDALIMWRVFPINHWFLVVEKGIKRHRTEGGTSGALRGGLSTRPTPAATPQPFRPMDSQCWFNMHLLGVVSVTKIVCDHRTCL